MGVTPVQPVVNAPPPGAVSLAAPAWLGELWRQCDATSYGLTRAEFDSLLLSAGAATNFGVAPGVAPSAAQQQAAYFAALKLNDLVLAQACAAGHERAWEYFVGLYHEPLVRAAIAITGNDTLGRDLAGSLYAELYGMKERDGERRCPLHSYRGRGSLIGWLRATLAQRHIDHHRRSHREEPLDDAAPDPPAPDPVPAEAPAGIARLRDAVEQTLRDRAAEDRFLLAAYYLDGRTLAQLAQLLHVHEATVSRRMRRMTDDLRKQVLRRLERGGLSRRAAEEALGADPRDLDMNLRRVLQFSASSPFPEKKAP